MAPSSIHRSTVSGEQRARRAAVLTEISSPICAMLPLQSGDGIPQSLQRASPYALEGMTNTNELIVLRRRCRER